MFERIETKDEQDWLKLRTSVLTATEVPVILGLNKYQTIKELLNKKINPVKIDNAYTWLGQALEPIVVHATNKVLNTDFKLYENMGRKAFFIDKVRRLGATPDATSNTQLLECKSTKPFNFLKWSDWPPNYYLMQLYTQLYCASYTEGLLSILSTNLTQSSPILKLPIVIFKLVRHENIDRILETEVDRFWTTLDNKKQFRINKELATQLELSLRFQSKRIY